MMSANGNQPSSPMNGKRRTTSADASPPVGEIQDRMAQLRQELRVEANDLTERAKQATHLSFYVRKFPLACVGLALVAGYALVPSKKREFQPTDEQLERLVRSGEVKVRTAQQRSAGKDLVQKLALGVGTVAARAAMAYVGKQLGQVTANSSGGSKA